MTEIILTITITLPMPEPPAPDGTKMPEPVLTKEQPLCAAAVCAMERKRHDSIPVMDYRQYRRARRRCCRRIRNWKLPCFTDWTRNGAPYAGRCSGPVPTAPNTARTAPLP